jgi:hypothetical protein
VGILFALRRRLNSAYGKLTAEKEARQVLKTTTGDSKIILLVSPRGSVVGMWAVSTGRKAPLRVRKLVGVSVQRELPHLLRLREGGTTDAPALAERRPGQGGGRPRGRRSSRAPRVRRTSKRAD